MPPTDGRPLTVTQDGTRPDTPADGPLPAGVGGFRIERVLGRGGMGVVYAAHDPKLNRTVAVKVMRAGWAASPVDRERFQREARAAGGLHHDHIVPVYQVGEDGGEPFLVMPLLPGQTLDARLKAGPVSLAEAVEIGRQAADGLAAAHAAGIVHRDVKPANLFLEARPGGGLRARLLDFGLARAAVEEPGLTGPGAVMGTLSYMAPEQAFGQRVDHRADLFSLGCLLYHLTTGQPPFNPADRLAAQSRVDPAKLPAARTVNPAVPTELSDLIRRLMAADPADRPRTAGAVAAELVAATAPRPRRRRGPLAAAAAAVAVVGLLVVLLVSRSGRPDTPAPVAAADPQPVASRTTTAPTPTPPPAPRGDTHPPPAADFDVLPEAGPDELKRWVGGLRDRGLRPDALAARSTPDGLRFTAVAAGDGQAWDALLDLVSDDWNEQIRPLRASRRPVAHVGYQAADGIRYTSFLAATTGRWDSMVYRDPGLFEQQLEGVWKPLRPTRVVAVAGADRVRYSIALTENRPQCGFAWVFDRSRADFDTEHRSATNTGLRLDALDVTAGPGGPAVHAVWVKDGGRSDFALDLTRDQLDRQLAERKAARSRPYTLSAYDTPAGLRYAVTWVPMGPN